MNLSSATEDATVKERRKSAASAILRWMEEEITHAPEEYIRALQENIALAVCRTALERTVKSGEKLPAPVLCSIDGSRLDNLHIAAIQDTASPDGRRYASEHSIKASKFLNIENRLIESELIQYTVPCENGRVGTSGKLDRIQSARFVLELIHEMRNG